MKYYMYKVIPPRPTFAADMTETESAIMSNTSPTGRTCWTKTSRWRLAGRRAIGPVRHGSGRSP
jgi:hypothetical protein